MVYSTICIVALLGMSMTAATNTAIISGAIETSSADETTISSNEKTIIDGAFIGNSRVGYNGETNSNNNNTAYFAGRNVEEESDEQNLDEDRTTSLITPTLWPTYAPTPSTKAPATPIPTYSPTQVPTTSPSPPTPSPSVTSTIRSPTSVPTPSPSVSFITGSVTAFPGGSPALEGPAASPGILPLTIEDTLESTSSSIISSPTPNPTWSAVSEGVVQNTAIPTSYWRREKRNLRPKED